jgi:isoquinoline 1-oxidoreductase beta subunit
VNRRDFLTGTAASVALGAAGLATPSTVEAAPLPLTPPDSVDYEDVGDSIIQASAPTIANVRLTLGADGVNVFEMPRLEQGTGIATALATMIAEEAGVTLDKVKVNSADAQPDLEAGQITGGSCTLRAFEPYIKALVLRARAAAGCRRRRARRPTRRSTG